MIHIDRDVTGRDEYVLCQALACAIAATYHLPSMYRPESDRDDMLEMLKALAKPERAQLLLIEAAERFSHLEERYAANDS